MKSEQLFVSTPIPVDGDQPGIVCGWDAPDGARRVTLNPVLIRELRQAAIQAFLAIPRRGVEIGGLLFGQVRQEPLSAGPSETEVFEIAAFEDVPCEHRFGPSYILDELDRKHLGDLLARHQRDGSPPVVGFYRSYTGREARLDEADRELMQTYFPHRHIGCLLLQPLSMERCAAGFQFWNGCEILPEPAYAPFPFEAAQMKPDPAELPAAAGSGGPVPDIADSLEVEPLETPGETQAYLVNSAVRQPAPNPGLLASYRDDPAPYSAVKRHRRYEDEDEDEDAAPGAGRLSRVLVPLLVCILAAIASGAIYELWKVTREPRWVQVGFDARPSTRELLLSWDATAPAVAHATRGVLAVTGSRNPIEIQLSPEQVRRGSFSYASANADVLFELRFFDKENTVAAGSLRVIRLPEPAPVVATIPAEPPPADLAAASPASPPAVRREVQPVISPGIRTRILARTVVPVIVQVDPSGHVTRASSKVNGHGLERYLAGEAVKAARQWSFSPARSKEGSPVAATKTISFEFTPAGH
jgi:TonB family protein